MNIPRGFVEVPQDVFDEIRGSMDVDRNAQPTVIFYSQRYGDTQVFGYQLMSNGKCFIHPVLAGC